MITINADNHCFCIIMTLCKHTGSNWCFLPMWISFSCTTFKLFKNADNHCFCIIMTQCKHMVAPTRSNRCFLPMCISFSCTTMFKLFKNEEEAAFHFTADIVCNTIDWSSVVDCWFSFDLELTSPAHPAIQEMPPSYPHMFRALPFGRKYHQRWG